MGITLLSGCTQENDTTETAATDSEHKEDNENQKGQAYVTTEVMTPEETDALVEGQFISAEEITKIPDAAVLESRDLAFIYCYKRFVIREGKEPTQEDRDDANMVGYAKALPADELSVVEQIGVGYYDVIHEFVGIQVLPVVNYFKDEDNGWIKYVSLGKYAVDAGYVISQEKLNELRAK